MTNLTVPPPTHPSARAALEALAAIEAGESLQRAIAQRLAPEPGAIAAPLSSGARAALDDLARDGFALTPALQRDLDRALELRAGEEDTARAIRAASARRKTLELQIRSLEQEKAKSGLFRSRSQQELTLMEQRAQEQLSATLQELQGATSRLERLEHLLRKAAQEAQADPALLDARWLPADGLAAALTPAGRFLLSALRELPAARLARSLARALAGEGAA